YQLAEFNFTPDVSINATYHFLKQRLALSVFGKYNGTLNTFAVNSDEEVTERRQDPYAILDASLSSKFLNKQLTLTVGAKNLLGVTTVASTVSSGGAHSSSNGISAGTGRSVFMSLQWNFHSKTKKK
ncbi:MAG: TonB-dependent receptor, partial [Flavobacteriales bacterium]|nr:TonB-dependent receptor [Flavobacteriales bacterium]